MGQITECKQFRQLYSSFHVQDDLVAEISALEEEMNNLHHGATKGPAASENAAAAATATPTTATAAAAASTFVTDPPQTAPSSSKRSHLTRKMNLKSSRLSGISTMFPEIFEVAVPCDPEAEVVLNIPKQISLPI